MYTVGKLAKAFGLSRTTLLYYEEIGLLVPSARSASNYRLYSERDHKRLTNICRFKETGLSLVDIKHLLDSSDPKLVQVLEARLDILNKKINKLRNQQNVIIAILKNKNLLKKARYMDRESWTSLLESAGLDQKARHKWHLEFERLSAEAHRDFLEQLGFSDREIGKIKQWVLEYDEK
jgi:DNA-binding transcriptional MerR regulator